MTRYEIYAHQKQVTLSGLAFFIGIARNFCYLCAIYKKQYLL